jgi:hypothetical protein
LSLFDNFHHKDVDGKRTAIAAGEAIAKCLSCHTVEFPKLLNKYLLQITKKPFDKKSFLFYLMLMPE